jgi:hypothetical protein
MRRTRGQHPGIGDLVTLHGALQVLGVELGCIHMLVRCA